MARLPILRYPDPRLHTVAQPVAEVDATVRQLVDERRFIRQDAHRIVIDLHALVHKFNHEALSMPIMDCHMQRKSIFLGGIRGEEGRGRRVNRRDLNVCETGFDLFNIGIVSQYVRYQ